MADPGWLDKMRSVGAVRRSRNVREGRDANGDRFKATRDEAGNDVIERAGDRQDVRINAKAIRLKTTMEDG